MNYFNVSIMHKGKKRLELIEAETKNSAIANARNKFPSGIIIKAEPTSPPAEIIIGQMLTNIKKSFKKKININDKIATIRQVAVMTDAGIPIHDTLNDIAENTHNNQLKEIYYEVSSDINAGKSLSDSMEKFRDDFGHVTLAMTKLGERTGNISGSYHKLADILESVRDNAAKFKKAISYPLIVLVIMIAAFVFLIMVIVPKFKEIFDNFNAELPLPTQILIKTEHLFSNYGIYVLSAIILSIYLVIYIYKNNPSFKYKVDALLINKRFYLINKVIFLSTMHKYTLVFGELVRSGIPVSDSLQTAVGMVENSVLKEKLERVNANIGRGMSLAESFEQIEIFENMLLQMIKAGEASGQLDSMLGKVTAYYDMQFQDIIDNLSTYLAPIMMIFIAGLLLILALGIFMPMWDLGKAVKG